MNIFTPKRETILDSNSGDIIISKDFKITQFVKPEEVMKGLTGNNIELKDVKNGWSHITCRELELQEKTFYFNFCFFENSLKIISISFQSKHLFSTYSKQNELKKKILFNKWLTSEVGNKRAFSWGEVRAEFDTKNGFSNILINYN